eukprot:6586097-Prorocentrum_lima.AAC.1
MRRSSRPSCADCLSKLVVMLARRRVTPVVQPQAVLQRAAAHPDVVLEVVELPRTPISTKKCTCQPRPSRNQASR